MNARQYRGRDLATRLPITHDGNRWTVPSQSGKPPYTVDFGGKTPRCTCPDYELSGLKCKHIYAVEYAVRAEAARDMGAPVDEPPPPCPPKKRTYKQDWPAYNAAQTNEKALFQSLLFALCRQIDEPCYRFGRPRLPMREMLFAVAFKFYSTVSCRRFMCNLADAQVKGYLSRVPHFNSIFNYLELPEMTPVLRDLIAQTSLALKAVETTFAVDSSGFTTCQYVRWYDAKYGQEMERHDWLKVHLMCGVTTNIVTSVEVTGAYGSDSVQFAPLLETTARGFQIEHVVADKAYSSRANLGAVAQLGGTPFIPFKVNARARSREATLWDQMYHTVVQVTVVEPGHAETNLPLSALERTSTPGAVSPRV
jgi:hypothetical protein